MGGGKYPQTAPMNPADPSGSGGKSMEQQIKEASSDANKKLRVDDILTRAGVSDTGRNIAKADMATVDLILSNPGIALFWAKRFPKPPSGVADSGYIPSTYYQAEAKYGFTQQLAGTAGYQYGTHDTGNLYTGLAGPLEGAAGTGATMLENGIILAPGQAPQYPDDPKVAGSEPWLKDVVPKWNTKKVNEWRHRLIKLGRLPSTQAKGAADDATFLNAIKGYYDDKWAGNPLKASQGGAGGTQATMQDAFDPAEIHKAVRDQYRTMFMRDPNEDEMASWTTWFHRTARPLLNKGMTADRAGNITAARFEDLAANSPTGKAAYPEAVYAQDNNKLANSIISLSQLIGQG